MDELFNPKDELLRSDSISIIAVSIWELEFCYSSHECESWLIVITGWLSWSTIFEDEDFKLLLD